MAGPPAPALDALGDATRRHVLAVVARGEQSAGTVVEVVRAHRSISQPAVSQHLRVLRESGLVTVRARGRQRLYAVDPEAIEHVRAWLAALVDPLAGLAQPLDALETEVARGRRATRSARAAPDPDARGTRPA